MRWITLSLLAIAFTLTPVTATCLSAAPDRDEMLIASKAKRKPTARERKLAAVRQDLHRNSDGKGSGFILRWSFDEHRFTLTVNKRRYEKNMLYAATMTARAIFDTNEVPLPKTLVIRDISGEVLGEGPFSNVPKLVE